MRRCRHGPLGKCVHCVPLEVRAPRKAHGACHPKLLGSDSCSLNAFPRGAAHTEMAALSQSPAVCSRPGQLKLLRDPGFVLVNALFFCGNGFNRRCCSTAPIFLPLRSCPSLLVSAPLFTQPSTSQFNHTLFRLKAALATPTNVLSCVIYGTKQ